MGGSIASMNFVQLLLLSVDYSGCDFPHLGFVVTPVREFLKEKLDFFGLPLPRMIPNDSGDLRGNNSVQMVPGVPALTRNIQVGVEGVPINAVYERPASRTGFK